MPSDHLHKSFSDLLFDRYVLTDTAKDMRYEQKGLERIEEYERTNK